MSPGAHQAAAAPGRRPFGRMLASLSVRNYRLYFWGYAVSVAGTWMQSLALAFLVLRLTGSGSDLGLATAARFLPFVVLGPVGGLIADRYDKRRLLYVTQSSSALIAVLFALLTALDVINVGMVIGLSLALGSLTVFDNPARQSLIGELVPREQLANAVTLNSVSVNLARVFGSAAGGALVAAVGLTTCFALNALSFAAVIASLAMMRTSEVDAARRPPRSKGQIREGLRYTRRTPALLLPLLMLTVTGMMAYEFPVTLPLVARGAFHGGAGTYGAMATLMAVGAVVGGLVSASRGNRRAVSLAWAGIGWGLAILAAAVAPNLGWELVALPFVGYAAITFNSLSKTAMQLAADPSMRGRVMALWAMAWGGTTVIGGPLVGWIAQQFGSRWSLVAGGVPTLALGLLMWPALRRIDTAAASRTIPAPADPAPEGSPAT
ncbi:Predicted arabinose efflux permease, MFS family [Actinacidiphila alni]|uniref:Predicted arabinose efflux permease, MFS family n=1 Tax=Actinacidiphila alni TaxID=380248 RepID=A0A1I1XJM4_9ACTN|nr:MFS transporter [Actinacidiphila alni]SFE07401.1 Predicted arabinose efflux permease, MFS family [Actinacidiphila alni]